MRLIHGSVEHHIRATINRNAVEMDNEQWIARYGDVDAEDAIQNCIAEYVDSMEGFDEE